MTSFAISLLDWSGRAFQLENKGAFQKWIAAPHPLESSSDYRPPCSSIPPRLRGKSSTLSRLVMAPFFDVIEANNLNPAAVDLVFASRFGEIRILESLLDAMYTRQPVSPLDFCNSVHHTATGYVSIATKNQRISRTVSAGAHTFGAGLIETLQLLKTNRSDHVVLLVGDETVPSFFAAEKDFAYGLALLFQKSTKDDTNAISLDRILTIFQGDNSPVSVFDWLRDINLSNGEK